MWSSRRQPVAAGQRRLRTRAASESSERSRPPAVFKKRKASGCWRDDLGSATPFGGNQPSFVRIFPNRQARTASSPRIHHFFVGSLADRKPFEQIQNQRLNRSIAHRLSGKLCLPFRCPSRAADSAFAGRIKRPRMRQTVAAAATSCKIVALATCGIATADEDFVPRQVSRAVRRYRGNERRNALSAARYFTGDRSDASSWHSSLISRKTLGERTAAKTCRPIATGITGSCLQ
jgi:hypothetical protein